MLDNYQLDILVENIHWHLLNKRVGNPLVTLHRNVKDNTLSVCITFTLYSKMYRQEICLSPHILENVQTYENLYTHMYRYIVETINAYMKTIDRTETWELVPKT